MPTDDEELKRLLKNAVDIARQGKQFTLQAELFMEYLASRLPDARKGVTLAQVLGGMHLQDLYLACACVHQVPEAISELETHLNELRVWLKRGAVEVDELCQRLRIELLVGSTPAGPRLAKYKGHGSLPHWIRVVASHMLPPKNNPSHTGTLEDALENLAFSSTGADDELDKRRISERFREALREALVNLLPKQRRMLRFYYLERLTTTELGKMLGISQATASRKLAEVREAVYEGTIRLLQKRLDMSSSEVDSLLVTIGSSFDVSISRLLREPNEKPPEGPSTPRTPEGEDYARFFHPLSAKGKVPGSSLPRGKRRAFGR